MKNQIIDFSTLSQGDELITLGARELHLRYSSRSKRLRLMVRLNGVVEVVSPKGVDWSTILSFIEEQHQWLKRSLKKVDLQDYQGDKQPDSVELKAVDKFYKVSYHKAVGNRSYYRKSDGELKLYLNNEDRWKELLHRFLADCAKENFPWWIEDVSAQTGLSFNRLSIRGQKQRWGSCSSSGNININYKLLLLEPELVEYLFIHELCHTVHHNHSRQYWALVEHHMPNFQELDYRLRRAMCSLPIWCRDH